MPYREVTAKIDFDAVIAAARSASVNWSETLKRIETNMADELLFVSSKFPPISPEIKERIEAFQAKQAEADLQRQWGTDPLELMNYLPDRWDVANWICKLAEVFEAVADNLHALADLVEG
jgi:hypothetical protein